MKEEGGYGQDYSFDNQFMTFKKKKKQTFIFNITGF